MTVKIGVVYFTSTDITGKLAQAAAIGVEEAGGQVSLNRIQNEEIVEGRFTGTNVLDDLECCDAVIFASPTYMGGPAAQFKAFADATSPVYSTQSWSGKVAAGITSGSGLNGDQSSTLQYFVTLASQHGMIWLGLSSASNLDDGKAVNRLGSQLGVVAQSSTASVNEIDLRTANSLGARIVNELLKEHKY